ncbi:MAG: NTP transferase domain-containing protein [Actinomycetales bacterium]|nr:NTP transferase domain-containing protein [Actinomycetales bacterium]
MILDAVVLAGGRSRRLGGLAKATLELDGEPLVARAVRIALEAGARRVVVVGPDPGVALPVSVTFTREEPAFGGPAAAIGAGAAVLAGAGAPSAEGILLLACDMPAAAPAVATLVTAFASRLADGDADGVIGVDRGRRQPLLAVVRPAALVSALTAARDRGPSGLRDLALRELLAPLRLDAVPVPEGSSDDVDEPEDLPRHGLLRPDGAEIGRTA